MTIETKDFSTGLNPLKVIAIHPICLCIHVDVYILQHVEGKL